MRIARSAPAAALPPQAYTALRAAAAGGPSRGVCAQVCADAAVSDNPAAAVTAAAYRACPPAIVRSFAGRWARGVRDAATGSAAWHARTLAHPGASRGRVASAAAADSSDLRRRAAAHGTAPALLRRLTCDPDSDVRLSAAANTNCPQSAVLTLAAESHNQAPPQPTALSSLLSVQPVALGGGRDALAVAAASAAAPGTLHKLARSPDTSVRAAVASSPRCRLQTLHDLARDDDWIVRSAAASNPLCGPAALRCIADAATATAAGPAGGLTRHGRWVATAPNPLPTGWPLARLVTAPHAVGADDLSGLSPAEARAVALQHVAQHSNCPPDVLERLAVHPRSALRAAVAANANCPPALLEPLTSDSDASVSRNAHISRGLIGLPAPTILP